MIKELSRRLLPLSVKRYANKKLLSIGYESRRLMRPIDMRGLTESPLEGLQRAQYCPTVVDISLARCRGLGLMAFPCSLDADHPFVLTMREYLLGVEMDYAESSLRRYYTDFQPRKGADYLGLNGHHWHSIFDGSPLWVTEPWFGVSSKKEATRKIQLMRSEGRTGGVMKASSTEWSFFGPLSNERARLEFDRLVAIAASVASRGYIRSDQADGDITGNLMVRESEYAVLISAGQHRVCALGATGHDKAPVRLKANASSVIDRREVSTWPGVTSGLFSEHQALEIFDRVFEGRQPPAYYQALSLDAVV